MPGLLLGWWRFAEDLVASLTDPRTDVATADAKVRAAIRESRLFAASETMVDAVERSWRASMLRRLVVRASNEWGGWLPASRVRAVGVCVAVAMTTALLLETLETSLDGPLRWILPLSLGVLGVVVAVGAESIARAFGERRA